MNLWLCGKVKEASGYLDSAARSVNIIIKGTPTKLNKVDIQNLYGLIVCSLGALSVKMGGDSNKAIELCEKCLKEFKDDSIICEMIKNVISCLDNQNFPLVDTDIEFIPCTKEYGDRSFKFPYIPEDALDNPVPTEENWLITKVYQNLLLESAFFPIISPNTPALKKEELEFEQAKTKLLDIIEDSHKILVDKRHSSSVPRKLASRHSPKRTTASVLKNRGPSMPWWQNNQFIDKVFKKSIIGNRDLSLLRVPKKKIKETLNLPPVDQIQEIYTSKVSPRRSNIRKREIKKPKNDVNDHIMVEFNPGMAKDGEKIPVTLVPIAPSRKH